MKCGDFMKLFGSAIIFTGLMAGLVSTSSGEVVDKNTILAELSPCSQLLPKVSYARQTIDLKVRLEAALSADELTSVLNECSALVFNTNAKIKVLANHSESFIESYRSAFKSCLDSKRGEEVINLDVTVENNCHW